MKTKCCIVGGGPAGMMLGYLLARHGVDVVVLEKYPDFFRDFRGDTIHPSTMDVLHELGLLQKFLKLPHEKTYQMVGEVQGESFTLADFSHLPVKCPYIAFVPQWDFLTFLSQEAKKYPGFHLLMQAEVTGVIKERGNVVGVKYRDKHKKTHEIRADLVVGADGRHSVVREKADFTVQEFGAPMDVLWFRLSRRKSDRAQSLGRIQNGQMMVMIQRGDYWQCGFMIRKGAFEKVQAKGLQAFRDGIVEIAPDMKDRVKEIQDFEQVKLLTVTIDRLKTWYKEGVLCIGDAAHAMSPIGGVGINLAIQDAVAAANILAPRFEKGVRLEDFRAVQKRREWPTRVTQRMQVFLQHNVIAKVLGKKRFGIAWPLRLLQWFPFLRRIPARLIGMGIRPEHVKNSLR